MTLIDTIRIGAFKFRSICQHVLDLVCLQAGFKIDDGTQLEPILKVFLARGMKACRVAGDDGMMVLATTGILESEELALKFCHSHVHTSRQLVSELIVVIRADPRTRQLPGLQSGILLGVDSVMCEFARQSPPGYMTLTTQSVMETRLLSSELCSSCDCLVCPEFHGFRLSAGHEAPVFSCLRDNFYSGEAEICFQITEILVSYTWGEKQAIQEAGVIDEFDAIALFLVAFVFQFLCDPPYHSGIVQKAFEDFCSRGFYWVLINLDNFANGLDQEWAGKHLSRHLENYNALRALQTYHWPEAWLCDIRRIKNSLELLAQAKVAAEFANLQAYILDQGFAFVSKFFPESPVLGFSVPNVHFPDQKAIEGKNYLVLASMHHANHLVYKCLDRLTRQLVVVKKFPRFDEGGKRELGMLQSLRHPNIVAYISSFESCSALFLVSQYCEGSLRPDRRLCMEELEAGAQFKSRQILNGLNYLHTNHIVHRDIKPENVFMDGCGIVKIADFGDARLLSSLSEEAERFDLDGLAGTPNYMAPECLHTAQISAKADMWSFGCLFLYLVTGQQPWAHAENRFNVLYRLGSLDELPIDIESVTCSQAGRDILQLVLQRDPALRPSAVELLNHPYFSEVSDSVI